jgi:hypothetical protein
MSKTSSASAKCAARLSTVARNQHGPRAYSSRSGSGQKAWLTRTPRLSSGSVDENGAQSARHTQQLCDDRSTGHARSGCAGDMSVLGGKRPNRKPHEPIRDASSDKIIEANNRPKCIACTESTTCTDWTGCGGRNPNACIAKLASTALGRGSGLLSTVSRPLDIAEIGLCASHCLRETACSDKDPPVSAVLGWMSLRPVRSH